MRDLLPLVLLLAGACSSGDSELVVEADNAAITLTLRNPTLDADPSEGVSSMRVDVVVAGEVVASESFDYPGGNAELEGIAEYGVVRFQVAGTDGYSVRSFGRSAQVVIEPGADQEVPITFLPVNRVFALSAGMHEQRSDHQAITLGDGRILMLGGHDPSSAASHDELEIYDFSVAGFEAQAARLDVGVGGARTVWTSDSQLLILGGETAAGVPQTAIALYDPQQDSVETVSQLSLPRSGHCVAQYSEDSLIVLGGEDTGNNADLVRYYPEDGSWRATSVALQNGGSSESATACAADEEGLVFVQGEDQSSTGILDPFTGEGIGDAFQPVGASGEGIYVSGAVLVPSSEDSFWLGGGVDLEQGAVTNAGQEFRMDVASFVDGTALATPRQGAAWADWTEEGWIAVAGGYADVSGLDPVNKIELLNPITGEDGPTADFDRPRPGCAVSSLPDGSLLVSGGFEPGAASSTSSAAIMVPYFEE